MSKNNKFVVLRTYFTNSDNLNWMNGLICILEGKFTLEANEFKIVDSPVVNAFAVPGGYVYFTRGIMAHFNNEAEFAGVLGHEIGHITARHSAKQ